jgi:DNA-binding MarR family transcriptional regulator
MVSAPLRTPVTDGHEVSSTKPQDEYDRQILQAIGSGRPVTQRSLSADLGVALGLTNLLVRRLVAKGYVRVSRMGPRHVKYLMTVRGWEALATATRLSMQNTVSLYTETREVIRSGLALVSSQCEPDAQGRKRVVFYGAGDVAEIAFVSLQKTDLELAGVVDDWKTGAFFGVPILSPDRLSPTHLDEAPFAHVVITSTRHATEIQQKLMARAFPAERVSALDEVHRLRPGWGQTTASQEWSHRGTKKEQVL